MSNFHVDFKSHITMAKKEIFKKMDGLMDAIVEEYRKDLYVTLSVPPSRHGRLYLLDGKLHRASAPGEPPAVYKDVLRGSLATTVESKAPRYAGYVKTEAPYAPDLELGTGKFMNAPRPAWQLTLDQNTGKYRRMVKDASDKRGGGK